MPPSLQLLMPPSLQLLMPPSLQFLMPPSLQLLLLASEPLMPLSLDLLSSSILRTLLPDVHAQHVQNQAMRSHNLRAEHPTAACPRSRELNLMTARDTFIGFALSCREHVTDAHAAKHITSCNRAALACAAD